MGRHVLVCPRKFQIAAWDWDCRKVCPGCPGKSQVVVQDYLNPGTLGMSQDVIGSTVLQLRTGTVGLSRRVLGSSRLLPGTT